jgi:hypothetical protein
MPWRQEGVRIDFLLNVDGVMKRDTVDYLWWQRIWMTGAKRCSVPIPSLERKKYSKRKILWRERIGKLSWKTHLRDMFDNTTFNDVKK